ncbi:hypothetical protein IWY39_004066 [Sphingobium sp. JAI105]|nr:hypothetical protein [Sphingobium sp. JAI105]
MVLSILFRRAKQSGLEGALGIYAGLVANPLRAPSTEATI